MDTMLGGTILATFVLLMMALAVGWVRKKEEESRSKAQPNAPLAAIDRRPNQYHQHPTEILLIHRYRLSEKADDLRSKKIKHFTADPELTAKLGLYDKLDAKEQAIRNEITLLDETLQQRGLEAGKHYYK